MPGSYPVYSSNQNWSERRCADGFVESAVGHYFLYFSTLVVVVVVITTVAKLA